MADRGNHYERAFEYYLRGLRLSCIPVVEAKRSFAEDQPTKSLDFIVATGAALLLIDVKGRKITPTRKTLANWATEDDIVSLGRWERSFGEPALAILTFVYHLPSEAFEAKFENAFRYSDRRYACLAAPLEDYRRHVRPRSPRWRTVSLLQKDFHRIARPFTDFC